MHRSPPQFSISTQGAFNENGVWLIAARLRFGRRAARQVGRVLLGETRIALMGALTREALRGRVLRANVIQVQLDAGGASPSSVSMTGSMTSIFSTEAFISN